MSHLRTVDLACRSLKMYFFNLQMTPFMQVLLSTCVNDRSKYVYTRRAICEAIQIIAVIMDMCAKLLLFLVGNNMRLNIIKVLAVHGTFMAY